MAAVFLGHSVEFLGYNIMLICWWLDYVLCCFGTTHERNRRTDRHSKRQRNTDSSGKRSAMVA